MVELDSAYVIEMPREREQALPLFVIPNFNAIIVAAGDEHGLRRVKVDRAHGA